MDKEYFKSISLLDFMLHLGAEMKGKDRKGFWFLAPYRSERNASLHIGYNNLWYDYGIGKGGDIFTLAGEMIGSGDFIKQAEYISQVMKVPMPDGYRPEPMPKVRQEPAFENIEVGPLCSRRLLNYLAGRGIPENLARRYCVQVDYRLHGRDYYAVGFENVEHGFELRNPFAKLSYPPKAISHIAGGNSRCNVFEGFIDFLSAERLGFNDGVDSVVLNSVANVGKAIAPLSDYSLILCYLDNDDAGRNALSRLRREFGDKVADKSALYPDHKDLNEYLMAAQPKISNNPKLRL